MRIDPAIATVLATLITALGAYLVARANSESKRREIELQEVAAEQSARATEWATVKESRLIALEDLAMWRERAHLAESHLAVCIVALRLAGLEIPSPPHPRT